MTINDLIRRLQAKAAEVGGDTPVVLEREEWLDDVKCLQTATGRDGFGPDGAEQTVVVVVVLT